MVDNPFRYLPINYRWSGDFHRLADLTTHDGGCRNYHSGRRDAYPGGITTDVLRENDLISLRIHALLRMIGQGGFLL